MTEKQIKLVSIDVDGTLFNSRSEISDRNKESIKKCLKNDIKIIINTARSIRWVRLLIKDLGLKDPQVGLAGAAIVYPDGGIRDIKKIPVTPYKKFIEFSRSFDMGLCVSCLDNCIYYEEHHELLSHVWDTGEITRKIDDLLKDEITRQALLITATIDENHPFNRAAAEKFNKELKFRRAGRNFLTVYNNRAGKFGALKKILKDLNIQPGNVMAIGDSEGDIGMLKLAGTGVAMGNASQQLKDVADYIVSDNDNDGVAEAIERFVQF